MRIIFIFLSIFFYFMYTHAVLAADDQITGRHVNDAFINLGKKQPQGFGIPAINNPNANVGTIVSNFILIMFIAGGLAVLVFILWGAFDWITSGGDKEKISNARRKIVNALIGLALLALSAFIVSLFGQIVGFNPLNTPALPRLDQPQP